MDFRTEAPIANANEYARNKVEIEAWLDDFTDAKLQVLTDSDLQRGYQRTRRSSLLDNSQSKGIKLRHGTLER